MSYTKVSKPSAGGYTNLNKGDDAFFDSVDDDFDSASVFFDGINQSAWTDVAKPASPGANILAGMATGLLIPLTYSTGHTTVSITWTKVSKPT